ncbi:MAG: UrcA family protein [Gammaproteobacteria bacterium]|nr:UrcA family protein [Gammaproteobacteria bacterium]MDH5276852.1 UrcA family protein [Gammaproteobacteria bacterium]
MRNRRISNKSSALAAVGLIACLGLTTGAEASGATDSSLVVNAKDLNLQSIQGAATLYSRLRYAAEAVCGLHEARGYAPRRRARRCTDSTLDAVVAQVGGSLLRARHYAEIRQVRRSPAGDLSPVTASARP